MFIFYHSNNVYVLFDDLSRSLLLLKKHFIPTFKISMNGGGEIIQLFQTPIYLFAWIWFVNADPTLPLIIHESSMESFQLEGGMR
jgi:hypothetical protein